ncbi:MAG TPA: type II secretion system F family protein [Usitatibacter sp.]|nr:type II secretion system F family protein [Usitatibacter sp.]
MRGIVLACDFDEAIFRLKLIELCDLRLRLDAYGTLRAWLSPRFAARDLALFYRTLADRLEGEVPVIEALESAAEFVRDPRLRHAIRMAALSARAASLHGALKAAGFARSDCNLLEAVSVSTRTVETLKSLADQIEREVKLVAAVVQTLLPSIISIAVLTVFFWAFVVFFAPEYFRFFTERALVGRMTPWVRACYQGALMLAGSKSLFTLALGASLAAAAAAAISGRLRAALVLLPGVAPLFERWEHLRLWRAFGVMARADIVLQRIFRMLAEAASLPKAQAAFQRAARLAESGTPLTELVARANFPDYIVRYIKASAPGRLDEAVQRLISSLEFDSEVLAARVKWLSTLGGFAIVMLSLLLAYRLTYIEVFYLLRKMVS